MRVRKRDDRKSGAGWWMAITICALTATAAPHAAPAAGGDGRLIAAARGRDVAAVQALIAQRVEVNARQADGATALHWAAHWNDVETVAALIGAGADVNAANDLGVTPLFLASAGDTPAIVDRLLAAGADPNKAHVSGATPLMEAARTGHAEVAAALITHGARVDAVESAHDQTALMWAAATHHPAVVQTLLQGGADLHARSRSRLRKVFVKTSRGGSYDPGAFERHVRDGDIVEVDTGGYTALLFAAQQGDVESASLLLHAGADPNEAAPSGMSALVVAAFSDHAEVGARLLEAGADADAAGAGYTALHCAILRGNFELVTTLLAHGANVDARITRPSGARRQSADYALGDTLVGATPWYLAAKFAEIPMLRALSAAGADPRLALPDGSTPIIAAMETGGINSLGNEGLGDDRRDRNVFFRAIDTQTADEVESDVLTIVSLAVAAGGDVNGATKAGDTALHSAAGKGLNRVIEFLVAKGANVDATNKRGQTPLQIAEAPRTNRGGDVFQGHTATAALLRQLGAHDTTAPATK